MILTEEAVNGSECLSCSFDFGQGRGAPFANGGIPVVFAYMRGIVPAAFALGAVGAFDLDGKAGKQFALHGTGRRGRLNLDL